MHPNPSKLLTRTHNGYHLGDNLVHLNFLRKVALAHPDRQFVHYAQWQHEKQLQDVIRDVPNIKLEHFGYTLPCDSIDSWRGAGGFWYGHEHRNDFVKFHVEFWFPYLASLMRVDNPIQSPKDMLFDYPAIQQGLNGKFPNHCDVLVINSIPGSGQFVGYNLYALGKLAEELANKGHNVVATAELPPDVTNVQTTNGLTVTEIGNLSLSCHTVVMVATGPCWPTFNIWNQDSVKLRVILSDSERLWLSHNSINCDSVSNAAIILAAKGLL